MDRGTNPWLNRSADDHPWGSLGGAFPRPPRSYSCSFCRREFRSAQALGGHMNVHRSERARLGESLSLGDEDDLLQHGNRVPAALPSPSSKPIPMSSSSSTSVVTPCTEIVGDGSLVGTHLTNKFPSKVVAASSPWFCHSGTRGLANQKKVEEKHTEGEGREKNMSSKRLDCSEALPFLGSPANGNGVESLRSSSSLENGIDLELRLGYSTDPMSRIRDSV